MFSVHQTVHTCLRPQNPAEDHRFRVRVYEKSVFPDEPHHIFSSTLLTWGVSRTGMFLLYFLLWTISMFPLFQRWHCVPPICCTVHFCYYTVLPITYLYSLTLFCPPQSSHISCLTEVRPLLLIDSHILIVPVVFCMFTGTINIVISHFVSDWVLRTFTNPSIMLSHQFDHQCLFVCLLASASNFCASSSSHWFSGWSGHVLLSSSAILPHVHPHMISEGTEAPKPWLGALP